MGKHLVGILILSLALLLPGRHTPCIESKPLHLAMILSCGETEAEQGFKDRLQELGYTVYYTVLNAEQDHKRLGVLLHELIPKLESFDYLQRLDDHSPGLRTLSARLDATHTFDFDAKRSPEGLVS